MGQVGAGNLRRWGRALERCLQAKIRTESVGAEGEQRGDSPEDSDEK